MRKGNTPLINGIILGAIAVYLTWYFFRNEMWNPATVIVVIIIALLSVGQIIIWQMFFRNGGNKTKPKKPKK